MALIDVVKLFFFVFFNYKREAKKPLMREQQLRLPRPVFSGIVEH